MHINTDNYDVANPNQATPEIALRLKLVSDVQLSPDKKFVAYVVGNNYTEPGKPATSSIWIANNHRGEERRFTYQSVSDISPRWSPDGRSFAFLSKNLADETYEIFIQNIDEDTAQRVINNNIQSNLPDSIQSIQWCPEGKSISFLGKNPKNQSKNEKYIQGDDAIESHNSQRFLQLYTVNLHSGKVKCVSPDGLQIWEASFSPNGDRFAAIVSDYPSEGSWYKSRLVTFSKSGNLIKTLYSSSRQIASPVWSPNNKSIAFLTSTWSDIGLNAGTLMSISAKDGSVYFKSDSPVSTHNITWLQNNETILTISHRFSGSELAIENLSDGNKKVLWKGAESITGSGSVVQDNEGISFAVIRENSDQSPDPWLIRNLKDQISWERVTITNPKSADIVLGTTEEIRWTGAHGLEIQGLLIRPNHKEGPYPMVTVIHGGPTWSHLNLYYAMDSWFQSLVAHGIAVFLPNPRGSTGRGLEFAEANIGELGDTDWDDVLSGIKYCVKNELANSDKLGIAGSSYGGFLAAWGITQTDIFKAAVLKAGIYDWRSFHGTTLIPEWDQIHHGQADPWDPDGIYSTNSPIAHIGNVKTPTLILHGTNDKAVPVEQSCILYRALLDLQIEARMVLYPREGHSIREHLHKLDLMQRSITWFYEKLK